jgi:hypothetical protein
MFQITPEPPSRPPSMISSYVMFSLLVIPFWVLSHISGLWVVKRLKINNPPLIFCSNWVFLMFSWQSSRCQLWRLYLAVFLFRVNWILILVSSL